MALPTMRPLPTASLGSIPDELLMDILYLVPRKTWRAACRRFPAGSIVSAANLGSGCSAAAATLRTGRPSTARCSPGPGAAAGVPGITCGSSAGVPTRCLPGTLTVSWPPRPAVCSTSSASADGVSTPKTFCWRSTTWSTARTCWREVGFFTFFQIFPDFSSPYVSHADRYFAQKALSSIHRSLALEVWFNVQAHLDGYDHLEQALGAFDMFVLNDGEEDLDEVDLPPMVTHGLVW